MFFALCLIGFSVIVLLGVILLIHFLVSAQSGSHSGFSSLDCGFSSVGVIQSSYCVHFYYIVLLFVLFDIEVVLLFVFISGVGSSFFLFLFFVLFVVGTYVYEVYTGKVRWFV